ncbi:restriction endonuclease subunit S [Aeromonas veronii]|uniref:Restriction endonuclease subunit S n=1 Tax=Aeromonas veronii TaxID=654 RepID=A0A4V3Z0D8_AERVE|nr:restriction endonuclease subunit S [Aeromonas veronii]THJ46122.1 restriction endonuclease subunit S [Aeromonas veronii]
MCSEWPLILLRDFVDLLAGFAFKSTGYSDGQDDVRLLRGDNIAPGRVRWDGVKRWSRENAVGLERYALEPGDVVLAMDRPWIPAGLKVAQVQAADTPSYLVQRVARIRPASREDCSFLFALLSTPEFESYIQNVTTGTAVPHISAKQILDFEFRLPPAYVRAKVGEIVAALNERITLLRETNTTLEAMAQALFKSWFVDFDPVYARARGEQPPGLAPEVAALFPDSFEESALGLVPKGWAIGELQDLLVLQRGFDLPASARTPGAYPLIAASGPNGTHNVAMAKGPGVITGRSGVLGKVFLTLEDYWPLNTTLWVKEFQHATPCYAYELLRMLDFSSFNAGSAVPTLNRNHIHSLKYLLPSKALVREFESKAMVLHQRALANAKQAETLTTLRDTLLPRLISGQLRLPDAEAQLSEVGLCQ